MNDSVLKYLLLCVKLVIMLLLVGWVVKQVHWQDYQFVDQEGIVSLRPGLISCLSGFQLLPFLAALGLQFLTVYLTAWRWRLLMFVQGIVLDARSVVRLSFLGEFFNNFLPGAMGGDVVKAYYVMQHSGRKGAALVSIFANRFAGLLAMVILSLLVLAVCLFRDQAEVTALRQPAFSIVFISVAIGAVMFVALNERFNNSAMLRWLITRLPFSRQLEVLRAAMHLHRKMDGLLAPVVIYSLLIVLAFVLSVMFIGLSLGINLHWYQYFLYMPLIMMITAVPITPGGVGVMEELFLYFFSSAGDPQKILAMALLYRLTLIVTGLPGGVVFLRSEKISRQDLQEGLDKMENDLASTGS
ncbi:MAG: flippase-like domain-containing protein [Proteobacteria bacterium]|nr:flippase-like domain-containing protein [Pseudomonadota bacterium]MBU1738357.1 flippase-like domain-containing protein [Pseudomonadota bacterium]